MVLIFATEQGAARALREAGLKATPQRLAILQSLSGDETHPTAQELYERLHAQFPTLSLATVYNTLSALTRIERCVSLSLGGALRFDPNVAAHDHAVCDGCGAIRDISAEPDGETQAPAHEDVQVSGFSVRRVERIYRGVCASCAQTGKAAARH